MRLAVALCALVFAGCGVLDDEGPAIPRGPDPALTKPVARGTPVIDVPRMRTPAPSVAAALDGGAIGIVDVTGAVGVRPTVLETASDARLSGIVWDRWGAEGAVGHGTLRLLTCPAACANGEPKSLAATVRLSGVQRCSGRLYFASGSVELASGEPPATYLRAPC
jgi:hypothetical protein